MNDTPNADYVPHEGADNGMEWVCDDLCPHPDHNLRDPFYRCPHCDSGLAPNDGYGAAT